MKIGILYLCLSATTCVPAASVFGQDSASQCFKVYQVTDALSNNISERSQQIERQFTRKSQKYITKLLRQEKKLKKKLYKKDSSAATELGDVDETYNKLKQGLYKVHSMSVRSNIHLSKLDSLTTAIKFLQQQNEFFGEKQEQLSLAINGYEQIYSKINQADEVEKFIVEREQYLKKQISRFGFSKEFNRFQRNVYYYRTQLEELKKSAQDPTKLEAKLLSFSNSIPAFKKFFAKYSQLAQLFPVASNDPVELEAGLSQLQTRAAIQQHLQDRFGTGPNMSDAMHQNLQAAQSELEHLKEKIEKLGATGADLDLPNFKPNNQKTKTFWKRIEVSTNFQGTRSNQFYPAISEIGLGLGYRFSDRSVAGVGLAYKLGLGEDIRHIKFTHEGIGLRSYFDVQFKGSFYASGGFELNYQKPFDEFSQVAQLNDWSQSGLIGVSKIISIKSKLFKKTKLQLLWDALSYQQQPRTSPFKFRMGYNF